MLTAHTTGAISIFHTYLDDKTLLEASSYKVKYGTPLIGSLIYPTHGRDPRFTDLQCLAFSSKGCTRLNTHHLLHQPASKKWMCRLRESMSPDDEYRSSRNIAISLFRRYRNFVERGGGDNLQVYSEFINAGVNAYALGCTDEGLRTELRDMKESGLEVEAMQSYGGGTSLKSKIFSNEIDECIFWLSIIFITILCTPQPTIVRWSSTPPVTDEVLLQWKGFCAIIANAYYMRGMAWLPVKTLQLEQMAVVGYAEEPSVVASRMRLVFSTLEVSCESAVAKSVMQMAMAGWLN
ncbi:hypothetical protein RHMOL_Rhmol02G0116100 [Rhododendron molle]|uniref:Uncharacterized protein n=1 Tax=Rhododendron molle TaxID=49168 RepID=A0ACC0PQG2_RHOML|nr:hypothetical protein RHMOL_Rhmol02G0116100 [Rhododendron molle]